MHFDLMCGTPKTGIWCDTCALPSRYRIPLYVLGEAGPFCIATADRCDGCSEEDAS